MLASTVKFSKYGRDHNPTPTTRQTSDHGSHRRRHTKQPTPQNPTACTQPTNTAPPHFPHPTGQYSHNRHSINQSQSMFYNPASTRPKTNAPEPGNGQTSLHRDTCHRLLRKEVIQPHLPVRLPCYDLVLITSPTFDGSLHKGWATGFGCYRLS